MGIGFNILPNISLGDMEAVMDIENEVKVMSEQKSVTRTQVNKDDILKMFTLDTPKTSVDTRETVRTQQTISKQAQDKHIETIKNKLTNDTVGGSTISNEEIELKNRLKAAEEQRRAEEARLERIRKLEEEARIAEQEAELARKKREAEERRIEEEQRIRQLRAAEEARKREEEERERIRAEQERIRIEEAQRLERIRQEQAKLDRIRAEQQLLEQQRLEQQRLEQQRMAEMQRKEQERLDAQRHEQERLEAERKEKEELAEKKKKEELLKQLMEQKKHEAAKKPVEQKPVRTTQSTQNKGIDKLKSSITSQEIKPAAHYERYSQLDTDALYDEVRKFLKKHNVEKKIVDIKILEDEFGKPNIKKLILKSYLISIGKGVTVGR